MSRGLAALVVASFVGSGCAAVGYGLGHASAKIDTSRDPGILEYSRQVDASTTYQQFRIVDTTGLLLAGLTNLGRQSLAREAALDHAAATGAKAGDVVEYSYEPFELLPGPRTTADLRLGLGPGSTTFTGAGGARYEAANYLAFDLGADIPMVASDDQRFAVSIGAAMLFESWGLKPAPVGHEYEMLNLDVYLNTKAGYLVAPNLAVSGKVQVGVASPLLGLLLGTPGLAAVSGVEVSYRPIPLVTLQAEAVYGLPMWLAFPLRGGYSGRLGLNAQVNFDEVGATFGKK